MCFPQPPTPDNRIYNVRYWPCDCLFWNILSLLFSFRQFPAPINIFVFTPPSLLVHYKFYLFKNKTVTYFTVQKLIVSIGKELVSNELKLVEEWNKDILVKQFLTAILYKTWNQYTITSMTTYVKEVVSWRMNIFYLVLSFTWNKARTHIYRNRDCTRSQSNHQ